MAVRSGNAPLHVELVTPAGTVQADATAIPSLSSLALIVSAGDNTAGIRLPKASKGKAFFVKNSGSGSLIVWPAVGDAINAIAADSSLSVVTLKSFVIVAKDSTTWFTIPLLPS